jgi:hypothetical protein
MAQFKPFAPNVLVNGQTVLSVITALSNGQDTRTEILLRNGIKNPNAQEWYPLEAYLNAFKEISENVGPSTLFSIGKAIPENAKFPPQIDSLEKALTAIDVAYKMNHKGGDIGYYKLVSFNAKEKKAVMECKNPYPSEFDRGIITTMVRKFRPANAIRSDVTLDTTQPSRIGGAESCTYKIEW